MESDLSSEDRVHIQLAGVDRRVPWRTQKAREGHIEEKKELKGCVCTLEPGKWGEEGVHNSVAPWISQVYSLIFTPSFVF